VSQIAPGTAIEIRALKSDGNAYRWWNDTVVAADNNHVITSYPIGRAVFGPKGGWRTASAGCTVYWFDRPYNLTELYDPDGRLFEIFAHIASPARLIDHILTYTDHELDVVFQLGQPPVVVDEDEFLEAARSFGYPPEFQASCYRAVDEVLAFIGDWKPVGMLGINRDVAHPRE
jgi:protein associated with RNAse G/E